MKTYSVYIKSHCEAPDYEDEFTYNDLKKNKFKCQILYADDYDEDEDGSVSTISFRCGGKLKKEKDGFKCKSCGQVYFDTDNYGK